MKNNQTIAQICAVISAIVCLAIAANWKSIQTSLVTATPFEVVYSLVGISAAYIGLFCSLYFVFRPNKNQGGGKYGE